MASETKHEQGIAAPAVTIRPYQSTYRWIKDGKTYIQKDVPLGNNWVEDDAGNTPTPPSQLPVLVGNSVFVSAQGKTVANGAVRESLENHFSSLSEAVAAAQSGDTIYVYGGTHTNTGNLYKNGVTIHCLGKPIITAGTTMFSDGGVAGTFRLIGDAIIQNGSSKVCDFSGVGSKIDLEFYSITTTASQPLIFKDIIESRVKIIDKFYVSSNTNCITFRGAVEMELIGYIFQHNATTVASAFGLIYFEANATAGNFNGNVKVTANKIISNGGRGGMIRIGSNDGTYTFDGNIEINCPYMDFNTVDIGNSTPVGIAAMVGTSLNVVINCNITTNKKAIHIFGKNGVNFTHYGKIISTATDIEYSLITNQGTAYSSNVTYNLYGEYINNGVVRDVIRVDGGTGNIVNLDGAKVYNNYDSGALTQTGIRIAPTVDLRLNNVLIYTPNALGAPYPIASTGPTNIRVYQGQACANIAPDVNITNLITGTSIIVDTDVI
jgi:hypothetical protein